MDVLLTWVGSRDPTWFNPRTKRDEPGPILSLLSARRFAAIYFLVNLFGSPNDYATRATALLRECRKLYPAMRVTQKVVDVVNVTDYTEVFHATRQTCEEIVNDEGNQERSYYVYLSPGTPQMQTVWFLLVQSKILPAKMLTATPLDLATPGVPFWRPVDLDGSDLPTVVPPSGDNELRLLRSQNENLRLENLFLKAQLTQNQAEPSAYPGQQLSEGVGLSDYLKAQEIEIIIRALDSQAGNASAAAKSLGLKPHTLRARLLALGIRSRRSRVIRQKDH